MPEGYSHSIKIMYNLNMKYKYFLIFAILIAAMIFGACNKAGSNPFAGEETLDKDASYAFGMNIALGLTNSMRAEGIIPDLDEFLKGFTDILTDKETRLDMFEAMEVMENALNSLMEQMSADAMQEGIMFLAENARRPGVNITSSGLQYEIITQGNGPRPNSNSIVQVHFEGKLINGMVFDTSLYGPPIEFPLNQVISGWTEGLQLMNVGSQFIFFIPPELAYGPYSNGPIPPFSTLIFTVELLGILN